MAKYKRYEYDCVKCKRHFTTEVIDLRICPKCRKKLPHCDCCGSIMARQYGFYDGLGKTIKGFGDICTSCDYEIRNKGFLHLESIPHGSAKRKAQVFLLPDGTIVNEMPAVKVSVSPHPLNRIEKKVT